MEWAMVEGVTALCGIAGTIFHYAVIKPLSDNIDGLRGSIDCLQESIERTEEKRQEMDKRLVAVEKSAKSAHHRIDTLERG